jgi:4-hydroxy-3-polyprenylbenzoate decarboxylase
MGGVVFPPLPAFYNHPVSIDEMVDHTVARVLDLFALGPALSAAWQGLRDTSAE